MQRTLVKKAKIQCIQSLDSYTQAFPCANTESEKEVVSTASRIAKVELVTSRNKQSTSQ